MKFYKDENNRWRFSSKPKHLHPTYASALEQYFTEFDKIFCAAKLTSEFEFVLSLLRVRSVQDSGWDTLENLRNLYKTLLEAKKQRKEPQEKTHIDLLLYGLIVEGSELYELLGNMINISRGGRFINANFPPSLNTKTKKYVQLTPSSKIDQLISWAKKAGFDIQFIREMYSNTLRNSVFHSDYTISWPEIRTLHPIKVYKHEELIALLNKGIAFYESLVGLLSFHISTYDKPLLIDAHKEFAVVPGQKVQVIVRKKYGVIGLKDNWTEDELRRGSIPFHIGRLKKNEARLLKGGVVHMPPDRTDLINRFLSLLPSIISRKIVRWHSTRWR